MMKLTLNIEASASVIAMILAGLPADGASGVTVNNVPPMPVAPAADDDDDSGPINVAAPTVDTTGLPWDERIHAATKSTNADGSWKKKKGASGLVASVEAELRAANPAPVAPPMPMPAVPLAAPVAPAMPPVVAPAPIMPPPPPPVPAPVAAPVAPPMPVEAPTGPIDFAQFMQHLSGQMTKLDAAGAPLVHADYLAAITNEISTAFAPHGVAALTAITDIATNPQMIDYARQLMQRDGKWS